ncbi:MAG: tripartite tricarboxylate transporter substrate binding protein [Pseudomonadota bacterium]
MTFTRRAFHRSLAAAGIATALPALPAFAADAYPTKPITLIVPFAPGGGNDTVARTLGQSISGPLGQPVVVDNKPGAGGSLGASQAARAPADGYTLFLGGVGSHALNPTVNPRIGYDPVKDFTPVAWLATAPMVLAVHPSVPANTVKQLIDYAKKNPNKLNYASNGNGSSSQLAAVIFNSMAGTDMVHVPYKGLSPAVVDLLSGNVQLMFSSTVAILPHVQAGKLKVLGVTSAKRLPSMPNVPTIAEEGLTGYETGSWYGILAPAGTPGDVVNRLNAEMNKALKDPAVRAKLTNEGADPVGGSPRDFAEHIRAELQRMKLYAKNIKVD